MAPLSSMAIRRFCRTIASTSFRSTVSDARSGPGADFRKGQQVRQQLSHARGASHDVIHKHRRVFVARAIVSLDQELRVGGDHAQRLLQVVAGYEREAFEILVGTRQLVVRSSKVGIQLFQTLCRPHLFSDVAGDLGGTGDPAQGVVERGDRQRDIDQVSAAGAPDSLKMLDGFSRPIRRNISGISLARSGGAMVETGRPIIFSAE